MNKKYFVTILAISLLSLLVYFILGGFKTPEFTLNDQPEISIYGTYYEGTIGSDSLQSLFIQARELVENNKTMEAIAIVYYGEVNEENGLVKNFIGVNLSDGTSINSMENWELRRFTAPKSIKACIQANVLAMPTPEDMLLDLRNYGQENKIKADTIFIEYYAGPNNLCVELLGN